MIRNFTSILPMHHLKERGGGEGTNVTTSDEQASSHLQSHESTAKATSSVSSLSLLATHIVLVSGLPFANC